MSFTVYHDVNDYDSAVNCNKNPFKTDLIISCVKRWGFPTPFRCWLCWLYCFCYAKQIRIARTCSAMWLAGFVAGRLSVTAGTVSIRQNQSWHFFDGPVARS